MTRVPMEVPGARLELARRPSAGRWFVIGLVGLVGCSADANADWPETDPDSPPAQASATGGTGGNTGSTPDGGRTGGAVTPDGGGGDAQAMGPMRADHRCSVDAANSATRDYFKVGPYAAGSLEVTLSDSSRSRSMLTRIYYPALPPLPLLPAPLSDAGPFPMLMYSHGYSSSRDESNRVGRHAASHGYVVVAPDYPNTNIGANGGMPDVTDVDHQPGDVSFLIDEVLAMSGNSSHQLAGAVDPERIGALGVSLGGLTTLLVGYHATMHDPRVKAVAPIAAPSFFFTPSYYDTRALPMLLFHGDLDAFIDYELNARTALQNAAPSARLLTVAAGSHTGFGAPVDGALLGLVAPLYAPPDAHPDNPDGLGCGYVAEGLTDTGTDFLDGLGGPEVGVVATEEQQQGALPCMGDEYTKPAINLDRQMTLLAAGVVAFFDAHLGDDADEQQTGCRFLTETLPTDPDVSLD